MCEFTQEHYDILTSKLNLTEAEKQKLEKLKKQLFSGSLVCRNLCKQYTIEDIAILFD